jgi:AcrR family transcriptional regulator
VTRAAPRPRRDAEASRRDLLDAAMAEFAEHGHHGARMDRVAERAGVSKPLIYLYFGDKEALYEAVLREAYVQIRDGERALDLDALPPVEAVRRLIGFTLAHFRAKPWFIRLLSTENLRGGATVARISDLQELHSPLVGQLARILGRGAAAGAFRPGVDAVQLYLTVAALFYFPLSNAHTLRVVFDSPVTDDDWLAARLAPAEDVVLRYLRPDPGAEPPERTSS